MFSINTDYIKDHDSPEPYIRQIAEAGFSHVHWVHHWRGDFLYSSSEIDQIGRWLKEYDLKLNDLHATEGREKFWLSTDEYARLAGVELVKNRLDMTAQLGGDAIVMHVQPYWLDDNPRLQFWEVLQRSMDAVLPHAQACGVKIAFENLYPINHGTLKLILAKYSSEFVGICYDPGHGNMVGGGLDFLETVKDQLLVLHLNDNDGSADQHKLIFSETVDWKRLAQIVATSSYDKPLGMEVVMKNMETDDAPTFLAQAMETCARFAKLVDGE